MPYATLEQLLLILSQVPDAQLPRLEQCLDDATDAITAELGFAFAGFADPAVEKRFNTAGGEYLHLPYHQPGSLATVAWCGGQATRGAAPAWLAALPAGTVLAIADYEIDGDDHTYLWRPAGWPAGRYAGTAGWGYGDPPGSATNLCLEVARDLFFSGPASMSSNTVGSDGAGALPLQYAWTHRQYRTLATLRSRYGDVGFA